ncbi:MAG TPA: hypothetical protein DD381_03035 [Lentisphaeria bacterium]|nr:MAG: hypothetical protein A2X47_03215 [Lentisphaerae bacterium GWF2_38_69]HBM15308.1 hypothetical protein [Lentisphaeria bacterium]
MKKILILLFLIALSFGVYYGYTNFVKIKIFKDYTAKSEIRDKALKDLSVNTSADSQGNNLIITAKWISELKTNPKTSSVKMEIICTQTKSAKGKNLIVSAFMKGITETDSNTGSISCTIKKSDISSDRPYAWVKIISVIDGKSQPPIIKYLGKFNQ